MASLSSSTYIPTASDELPRSGSYNEYYKQTINHADTFKTQQKETHWFQANRGKVPYQGSLKNTTNQEQFKEGVLRLTSEPKIIYKQYNKVMSYTFKISTSTISSHVQTAGYMKVTKGKGIKQLTV